MLLPAALLLAAIIDPPAYRVDVDIHDYPAVAVHYSMLVAPSHHSVFQFGSTLPATAGATIDLTLLASEGKLTLQGAIELRRITGKVCTGMCMPLVTQTKIEFNNMIELDRITAIQTGAVDLLVRR